MSTAEQQAAVEWLKEMIKHISEIAEEERTALESADSRNGRAYYRLRFDAAQKQIAAAQTALAIVQESIWQPIETAPKYGVRMLCSYKLQPPFNGRFVYGSLLDDRDCWREATHWRPIPQPPKEAGS